MEFAYLASEGVTLVKTSRSYELQGTTFDDTIFGAAGIASVYTGYGSDLIDLSYAGIRQITSYSEYVASVLSMEASVNGGNGQDTLQGSFADDSLFGGNGDDLALGGWGYDTLMGGAGNDSLYGGGGRDHLFGGGHNDLLHGGRDHDTLEGSFGDDWLSGGDGDDRLFAGDGDDIIFGGANHDLIEGADGNDWVDAGDGHDVIRLGAGDDTVVALEASGNGADRIWGDAGHDRIHGGGGYDTLEGGTGDDTLNGGSGHDFLSGGAGADVFVIRDNFDSELILDFSIAEGDRVLIEQDLNGLGQLTVEALQSRIVRIGTTEYLDLGPEQTLLIREADAAKLAQVIDEAFTFI